MCPYARFQSAMFDKRHVDRHAMTEQRGEPRGAGSKESTRAEQNLGDCVACKLCVQVCPTGIDIRDGLQYECIGCAACIDACDHVMEKAGMPEGPDPLLDRAGAGRALRCAGIWGHAAAPARAGLHGILAGGHDGLGGCGRAARAAQGRRDSRPRRLAREAEDGRVENTYRLQVMNTAERLSVLGHPPSGLPGLRVLCVRARRSIWPGTTRSGALALARPPRRDIPRGFEPISDHRGRSRPTSRASRSQEKTVFLGMRAMSGSRTDGGGTRARI